MTYLSQIFESHYEKALPLEDFQATWLDVSKFCYPNKIKFMDAPLWFVSCATSVEMLSIILTCPMDASLCCDPKPEKPTPKAEAKAKEKENDKQPKRIRSTGQVLAANRQRSEFVACWSYGAGSQVVNWQGANDLLARRRAQSPASRIEQC